MSSRINHGGCVPLTSEPESPSSDHQIGALGSNKSENIISLPSEDTIQGPESDCEVTSSFSFDDADPPQPETFSRVQNHDPFGRKSSFSPRCADDGLCHADANLVSEVPETPPSTIKSSGGASVSDKDDDGLLSRCMLYEGEEGLLDVPRSEVQLSFEHVAETSPPQLDHQVAQGITSSSLYSKVDSTRSNPTSQKRPASATLETDGEASGPRTRARARARAEASEASSSLPTPRSARPYSAAEDEVLQKLVARGLAWEEIEKEFGLRFAKRTSRSLQMRWSRNLKLTAPSTRCSKRKRSSPW
ncbi:SANT/Myb-like DNA-binding domain-containing protein [Aspergillus thermomutatus]|uniref:Myb-like domain-containing protein n=1 Tax=Aspergillus thermomutatus TaxID=41047 RepID=A0A397FY85_ASPTH|nr:uncharacterized protein CDV56_100745 [Aspergillus thermomutatus]RHZ43721.1 hypothetical protein CDV56_100745 [Aspergillus thermomutatus]